VGRLEPARLVLLAAGILVFLSAVGPPPSMITRAIVTVGVVTDSAAAILAELVQRHGIAVVRCG
jgi:hypothetical protein